MHIVILITVNTSLNLSFGPVDLFISSETHKNAKGNNPNIQSLSVSIGTDKQTRYILR
jgi:hypothetical protein